MALTLLTAGVTTPDPASFNSGLRTTGGGRPYVNGNREESNNFLLDGVDNNFTSDNLVSYQPNPDAIEEFKLITNNASAEFGNFQGGIINVVIKSGTNQFHGDAFEYFRNDKLNANNWGNNWQRSFRGRRCAGISSAAPSAARSFKDKLFFFVDYQGLRQAHSAASEHHHGDAAGMAQWRFLVPARSHARPAAKSSSSTIPSRSMRTAFALRSRTT